MWELGEHFRKYANDYRDAVHEQFFLTVPEARQVFSLSMQDTHRSMVHALAWVIEHAEPSTSGTGSGTRVEATVPAAVREKIMQLGRDHRRHGFPAEVYERFEKALIASLRALSLTRYQYDFACAVIHQVCEDMAAAAREADLAGEAPAYSGHVVAVDRPTRDTAVIRVEAGMPAAFEPGQYFPVTTQYLPGQWRMLTPAQPSDATGQLVFHIAAVGEASRSLAHTKPGDWWTLGRPTGSIWQDLRELRGGTLVIVAYGTGWAAARCLTLAAHQAVDDGEEGLAKDLSLQIFAVADSPGAHYDTHFQQNLQALYPDLSLRRIIRQENDPWLLGAQPLADAATHTLSPDPTDVVVNEVELSTGTPTYFALFGSAEEVAEARRGLEKKGIDKQWIFSHSWGRDREWLPEDYAAQS